MSEPAKRYSLERSPFQQSLLEVFEELPEVFKYQYALDEDEFLLKGRASRVWQGYRILQPLFYLFSWVDVLFPESGENIDAKLHISRATGAGRYHSYWWRREFAFSKTRRFDAYMYYDDTRGCVIERLGPWRMIEVSWEIEFLPPTKLRVYSKNFYVGLGPLQVKVPKLLAPKVEVVEEAIETKSIQVEFCLSLPILGQVFGFEGLFTAASSE